MILGFRRRHVQRPRDPLAVWFLDQILRVVAHRENRRVGRCYFTISDLQENIARTKSRHMSWPTFVDILKHPPLRAIEVPTHERCADCVASRDFRNLHRCYSSESDLSYSWTVRPNLLRSLRDRNAFGRPDRTRVNKSSLAFLCQGSLDPQWNWNPSVSY